MRQRLPLILSATAVVVAVLGATSLGEAAGNAVGQTVKQAKAKVGLTAPSTRPRRGPRGPRGPRGRAGPQGPPGADGTAVAYAGVSPFGLVSAANSHKVTSANVSRISDGVYCMSGLTVTAHNAVASVGNSGSAIAAVVDIGAVAGCPSETQITVRTYEGEGLLASNEFMININ